MAKTTPRTMRRVPIGKRVSIALYHPTAVCHDVTISIGNVTFGWMSIGVSINRAIMTTVLMKISVIMLGNPND